MTNEGIRIEQHERQLLVAVAPRDGLDILVSASANVAHSEIQAALEDASKEVRHTRALSCVDGFDRIDQIAPWDETVPVVVDGGEDPVLEAFEKAAAAQSFNEARYWSNVALQRYLLAQETEQRGEGE